MGSEENDEGSKTTTVPIKRRTKDRLARFCTKDKTYDQAINEMLDRFGAPKIEEV